MTEKRDLCSRAGWVLACSLARFAWNATTPVCTLLLVLVRVCWATLPGFRVPGWTMVCHFYHGVVQFAFFAMVCFRGCTCLQQGWLPLFRLCDLACQRALWQAVSYVFVYPLAYLGSQGLLATPEAPALVVTALFTV